MLFRSAWRDFGSRQIETTFGDTIYLTELARANSEYFKARDAFQEFCGDAYDVLLERRMATLGDEELAAWNKPEVDRSIDEIFMAAHVDNVLKVPPMDVARATSEDKRVEAMRLAKALEAANDKISHIEIYRNQINYAYWEGRCVAEQDDAAILARTSMYEANQLLDKGELDAALEKYETAWTAWAALFNSYPAMMIDDAADEVMTSIERYRRLFDQPELPEDFGLKDFLTFRDIHEGGQGAPAMMSVISSWPEDYPDRNFLDEFIAKSAPSSADTDPGTDATAAGDSTPAPRIDVTAPSDGAPPRP